MTRQPATVLIVDDDASVRRALARLVQSAGWKASTFASAREFLDAGPPEGPACLVLDVRMPGLSGLDLQSEMTSRNFRTPIIFVTGHGDVPMSVKAMKGGAVDFLVKPFQEQELLRVIGHAVQMDEQIRSAGRETAEIQDRIGSLTPREREVLSLVVRGLMNKEIADTLGMAQGTVKIHRGRVMRKMRVRSVAELVRAVHRVETGREASAPGTTKVR